MGEASGISSDQFQDRDDAEMAEVLDVASVRTILLGENRLGDCGLEELLQEEGIVSDSMVRPKPRKAGHRGGIGGKVGYMGIGKVPRHPQNHISTAMCPDSPLDATLGGMVIEGLVNECADELLFSPLQIAHGGAQRRNARGPSPLCLPSAAPQGAVSAEDLGDDGFLTAENVLGEDGLFGVLDDDMCRADDDIVGAVEGTVSDEIVRQAVRAEMSSGSLTQSLVSQQAGISPPMLCAWLGGKPKGSPQSTKRLVRSKLLSWLRRRGIFLTQSTTPASTSTPSSPGADAPSPTVHAVSQPAPKGKPRAQQSGRAAVSAKSHDFKASEGGSSKSRAPDAPTGKRRLRFNGESAAAEGGVRKGNGRIKLTADHLHLAYVMYLEHREREGVCRLPGHEESFCLKCKDGGDVLLCDFGQLPCSDPRPPSTSPIPRTFPTARTSPCRHRRGMYQELPFALLQLETRP